ncbi:TonB-dependent receptor [Oleiharenicola lentus]|uniref:TonB-dependent receptor n=1 Tax=Oleiharenicola lentus TaxID=2508720 RepID=UPI003F6648D4
MHTHAHTKPTLILRANLLRAAFSLTAFALTCHSLSAQADASTVTVAAEASVGGHVTNAVTGSLLEGATVRLAPANRTAVTARDGSFSFTRVPAGSYNLMVSYEGLETYEAAIEVGQNAAVTNVALRSEIFQLDRVMVSARLEGQAAAINNQRVSPSLRTTISADALGQIREGNIGDALVRLPGLSVETRAGVLRTATIRGLAPQYNTVNVDGLRMTNVDGDRNIAIDSFPANMLARVEVVKAPTPDLPADAIGGTVNLITRSAFDRSGRTLTAEAGTSYNERIGNWNSQFGGSYGERFGKNKQFGALVVANYYHDLRGYDQLDQQYTVNATTEAYTVSRAYYYDRAEEKVRIGGGAAFDYRPSDTSKYFAKALYSYDYRDLNQRGTDYRPADSRVDVINNYREPKNVFQMYIVGGENRLPADIQLDYRASYSKAKKDYPETLVATSSFNNVTLATDRTNPDFPTFTVTNGVDLTNPALLAFRQVEISQVPRVEDEWSYDVNATKEFVGARIPWSVRGGLRFSRKDSSQAQPLTVRYSGLTTPTAGSLVAPYSSSDFMSETSNGRSVILPFYPNWSLYKDLVLNSPGQFSQNAAAVNFTNLTRANADFATTEDIDAAYVMSTADFGKLRLIAGLRGEETTNTSASNNVTLSSTGAVTSVTRVNAARSYSNIMAGLHARYLALNDRLVFRAAYTEGLSRPAPADLIGSVQENVQINQRNLGNPDLQPAESQNFDASAEYYFGRLGLLSAGVFHKDIKKFVFTSTRTAADGVRENLKVNGEGGTVTGLELVWQQNFTFLPAPFDGLGVVANYTRLDSEGKYPGRETENLPLALAPDFIFNGIVSYTKGPISLTLSYNELAKRIEAVGASRLLDTFNSATSSWDAAAKYRVFKGGNFFFNVKNLTNEPTVIYQGNRANPTSVVYYGTQYNFGINFEL